MFRTMLRSIFIAIAVGIIGCLAFGGAMMAMGWRTYVVHTGSMTPNIPSGDLVIDRPAGPVHVGQVITFAKAPGVDVTHRVVALTRYGIQTKGDANPSPDFGYVTPAQVVGRVAAVVPDGGFLVAFCSHPVGIIGVILFIGSIGLAWPMFRDERKPDLRDA